MHSLERVTLQGLTGVGAAAVELLAQGAREAGVALEDYLTEQGIGELEGSWSSQQLLSIVLYSFDSYFAILALPDWSQLSAR